MEDLRQTDPAGAAGRLTRHVLAYAERLDVPGGEVTRLGGLLSPEERERAARFRVEGARRRFAVARGRLRERLAALVGVDPQALRLAATSRGRPYLAWPHSPVEFSIGRSGELAVLAFAVGRRVGVDVEEVVAFPELEDVARARLAPAELAALLDEPWQERTAAFLRCWTRKEAVAKALGTGLVADPRNLEVGAGAAPASVRARPQDAARAVELRVETVAVGASHQAAVAAEGDDWLLRAFQPR